MAIVLYAFISEDHSFYTIFITVSTHSICGEENAVSSNFSRSPNEQLAYFYHPMPSKRQL